MTPIGACGSVGSNARPMDLIRKIPLRLPSVHKSHSILTDMGIVYNLFDLFGDTDSVV